MRYEEEIYRRSRLSTGEKIGFLLLGSGIGAALALLFAPKSGEDLREEIADATRKSVERGRHAATQIGERAGEYYEVARERAGEYYDATRERAEGLYDTTRERTEGLVEKAREAAGRPKNTFSAAIEAGKQAYYEEKRRTAPEITGELRPNYAVEGEKD